MFTSKMHATGATIADEDLVLVSDKKMGTPIVDADKTLVLVPLVCFGWRWAVACPLQENAGFS